MSYYGSWKIDDLLTFSVNTHASATGAATDADAVPSYRVYEDETGTAILSGSMAKLDDANTTGFYSEQLTLSAANGFEKGKCYTVYISATVASVVGTTHHNFQIEAEVDANTVSPSVLPANVTQISGDSAAADNAEAFFDGTGYAGTNNVIPNVTLVATLTTYTGNTPQTGDSFARIGAAGAGLTAVPWNATWDAEVQSEVDDALVVHRLDELLNADSDIDGAAPPTVGSVFHELMSKTAGSFTYDQTTDSLEALRDRGDAAWLTAAGFSTHTAADVWAVATRLLTAGTNIALAKGVGVTGFTDIDAAGVRTAVGLAAANLDTQLDALPTAIENADALLVRNVSNVEATAGEHTLCTIILAMLESSISGTTWTIRKTGGTTLYTKTVTVDAAANPVTGVT